MEWNRRAEQGERGRRRAYVLEALPCSRRQHTCCNAMSPSKQNTVCARSLKVRIDTKCTKNRNYRQLRRPIVSLRAPQGLSQSGCTAGQQLTSLAPQALKKSQSSAGSVEIVSKRRRHNSRHRWPRRPIVNISAPQVLFESLRAPQAQQ